MSGHTPGDPVIARSEQLRARLEGMRTLVEVFSTQLLDEIKELRTEVEQHTEGADDDGPG